MKLEVGMYVRFDYHRLTVPIQISKIEEKHYEDIEKYYYYLTDNGLVISEEQIIKASNNIIDILEIGDYVNGYYVSKIWKSGEITHYVDEKPIQRKERQITIQAPSYGGIIHLHNEDIKSIVTKESMESVTYYVK